MKVRATISPSSTVKIAWKNRSPMPGHPKTVSVSASEIQQAIAEPLKAIVESIRLTLERIPPELAADIMDKGIVLAGGGALIRDIDRLIREETGLPVMIAEDPLSAVVLGSGAALDDAALLRQVALGHSR